MAKKIPCIPECKHSPGDCDGWPGCPKWNTLPAGKVYCPDNCQAKHTKPYSCTRDVCNGSDGCAFETDKVFAEPPSAINHPSHYGGDTPYETIKVIEAWKLNYNLGNCVKYISRAGKKDDLIQDLEKARFYLDREINNLKKELK